MVNVGGIVFNVDDPHQKRLHEHLIRHTNYSGYLKTLIDRDMQGTGATASVPHFSKPVEYVPMPDPIQIEPQTTGSDIGWDSFT